MLLLCDVSKRGRSALGRCRGRHCPISGSVGLDIGLMSEIIGAYQSSRKICHRNGGTNPSSDQSWCHGIEKIEKLQEKALRYSMLDFKSPYQQLLHNCGNSTLFLQRLQKLMEVIYRILNDCIRRT